jgi:hypothetical protein
MVAEIWMGLHRQSFGSRFIIGKTGACVNWKAILHCDTLIDRFKFLKGVIRVTRQLSLTKWADVLL